MSSFLIDKFEATQQMLQKPNCQPIHWQDNSPETVERVRWRDAKQYCNERSLLKPKPCYNEKSMDWTAIMRPMAIAANRGGWSTRKGRFEWN